MTSRLTFTGAALGLIALSAFAADPADLIPPDQAFLYSVEAGSETLDISWRIEPGYYLYRERMGFESASAGIELGEAQYPDGKIKEDEFFGRMEIYRGKMVVRVPYLRAAGARGPLELTLRSQGCADIGICFPPQKWTTRVNLPAAPSASGVSAIFGDAPAAGGNGAFLPPNEAFAFFAEMADAYTIRAWWEIADGYYLYRDKFSFDSLSDSAQLGAPRLPAGTPKHDEFFGQTEVFYGRVEALIPISRAGPGAAELSIAAGFQGCAEDGICYPPMTDSTLLMLSAANAGDGGSVLALPARDASRAPVTEQDRLANLIGSGALPLVLASFFGLGLLLAFTPCVFPMIPILSGIIVGQGPSLSTRKAFTLSAIYVLSMAATYTVAGVVTALMGQNLQAMFQHPAILIVFSLVFIVLALAMFGVYDLQLPASMQSKLAEASARQRGGTLVGVGVMGVLSALIVGPCVAAPLAATLIFIGQSGDPVRGGLTLFALSLGMGAPLLVFGTSAGRLLPRAGPWMVAVKFGFGVLMLGIAIWMLSRILPGPVGMLAWAALALFTGLSAARAAKGSQPPWALLGRGVAALTVAYGALLLAGAALGGSDPLRPLEAWRADAHTRHLEFSRIKSVQDLELEIERASASGRALMLDFYADWCVSCKEMEKYTFTDPAVQAAIGDAVLVQADVTANDEQDQALLKHFGIFGPPTIAFFGADGRERTAYRVIGFMSADLFGEHARLALHGE